MVDCSEIRFLSEAQDANMRILLLGESVNNKGEIKWWILCSQEVDIRLGRGGETNSRLLKEHDIIDAIRQ